MSSHIGYRLRQARESWGLSLEEMEQYTRISATDLNALESGDFDRISSPYYIRIYLRTYAKTLGLDSREIVNEYRQTVGGSATLSGGGTPFGQGGTQERSHVPSRRSRKKAQTPPVEMMNHSREGQESTLTSRFRRQRKDASSVIDGNNPSALNSMAEEGSRKVSMPPDMPEPQELGLSPQDAMKGENTPDSKEEKAVQRQDHAETAQPVHIGSRSERRKKKKNKQTDSKWGTWYTRFLLLMTILLIPATIYVFYLYYTEEPPQSVEGKTQKEEKESKKESSQSSEPILTPVQTGGKETDYYELTNADEIELNIKAKEESQFQIRKQEVGDELKEGLLKKGGSFSYKYDKGDDIYLELESASSAAVTVNGKKVKTSYDHKKLIHIALIQ
ncbi:helix-turn-helix domain-containing protein [Melghirimyces algeriensis]|uniref:Helix-turn-helix domain-containing protein n=1 Tax=Melghirimyces algeriensis TaxID=910412 RepID=A0A521C895_9BACL|nr:helix-turn-helix domain-containing protein [Melghirimyces algeriensis]SMO55628.1 Helix-turn-helix domain-containing protein [Melghirimyces algeriensis]